MAQDYKYHAVKVEAWIKSNTTELSRDELVNLFEFALKAIWESSSIKMSEVTLSAVMDRAVFTSSDTHKFMLELRVTPTGIQWDEFRKLSKDLNRHELIRAFSHLLKEFISISSNISGGLLNDSLLKALATVTSKQKKI